MKYLLLAAVAVIAAPLAAQEAPTPPMDQAAPMADAPPPPEAPPAPDAMMSPPPAPTDPNAPPPVGGYQPSGPAISGPVAPGAQIVFRQAPTPDQAYPAPAPLKSYPVCKKGQFDQCRNPGGR